MAYRVARSINVLRSQLDQLFPDRSRASDGDIADSAHSTTSDHYPHDFPGWGNDIVTAGDYTHDPSHGADMGRMTEALRVSRDARIKYVIFNQRIFSATNQPWIWRPYTGTNPHTKHAHLSVVGNSLADSLKEWEIIMLTKADVTAAVLAALNTDQNWRSLGVGTYFTNLAWRNVSMRDMQEYMLSYTHQLMQLQPETLAARLDAILIAAIDDGQSTVTMTPEERAALVDELSSAVLVKFLHEMQD